MSTTCALCEQADWLDTGICPACADADTRGFVFLTRHGSEPGRRIVEETLRNLIGAHFDHRSLRDVARGQQPLALLPQPLALRAAQLLDSSGLRARVLPRNALHRALPASFNVMLLAVLAVGVVGATRVAPVLLLASVMVVATLLLAALWYLRSPLLDSPAASAHLPQAARLSLTRALAQLDDVHARALLLDIARMAEKTLIAMPEAFRSAALGVSVGELVAEAGPLALEAAHLRTVATELGVRDHERNLAEAQLIDDAANARFTLLQDVLALLARLARDGARSDGEVRRLLQLVRQEAARRVEADDVVAALLSSSPSS